MRPPRKLVIGLLVAALPAIAVAKRMISDFDRSPPAFELLGRPIGGAAAAAPTAAHLTGSRIMAVGDGALVIDADTGALIRTDKAGKNIAQLALGREAGLLTYDAATNLAYVADRKNDRIAVIKVGAKLELAQSWKTPAEPFGIALSPDKKQLLVSTIADRSLVAYDTATGTEKWRSSLGGDF